MTNNNALAPSITHRDTKGRKFIDIVETAYDKASLSDAEAQLVNEAPGLGNLIAKFINENRQSKQYLDEQAPSNSRYPSDYKGPKPIEQQIQLIAQLFKLDQTKALAFTKTLPELPNEAEGWFAIPSPTALSERHYDSTEDKNRQYHNAVNQICMARSGQSEVVGFNNYIVGKIDEDHLKLHPRTTEAYEKLSEDQDNSDILIVACQLGMKHRGKSVRKAITAFSSNEFGLDIIAAMAINLTHPTRFVRSDELDIDLPGNLYCSDADDEFVEAPHLCFIDDELELDVSRVEYYYNYYGSASGFLPK